MIKKMVENQIEKKLDINKDGKVNFGDLKEVLFDVLDQDDNGKVELSEFLNFIGVLKVALLRRK